MDTGLGKRRQNQELQGPKCKTETQETVQLEKGAQGLNTTKLKGVTDEGRMKPIGVEQNQKWWENTQREERITK